MPTAYRAPVQQLKDWAEKKGDAHFLRQPKNRKLVDFSWKDTYEMANKLSIGLQKLGLQKGDRVALLSKNCAEWIIADLAIMMGGFVSVPIYPTANGDTIHYVLDHSDCKAIFIGKLDKWADQEKGIPGSIIRIDMSYESMPCQFHWNNLIAIEETQEPFIGEPEDTLSIIYTSGSTGNPKGAVLTYESFSWAGQSIANMIGPEAFRRCISYLPLAHITERCYLESSAFFIGTELYFTESLDTFVEDLNVAAPTAFISVPRLWSLFQQNILNKIGRKRLDFMLKVPILSGIIKKKIITTLGLQHAKILGCGSAPVAPSLIEWYRTIGANVSEAWGMTENCAYATTNFPFNASKIGTVGKAQDGCEVQLSDEGELLFKSPGLMKEYYREPEATAAAFTEDGFFKTGDLATIDDDGYVSIVGRIKDNFKTAKGKYVSPVAIERKLAQDPFVELLSVIGSGLPAPVALIQLSEGAKQLSRDEVRASIHETLETTNAHIESHARMRLAVVVSEDWTPENDIMTPTLKIKRHVLEAKYKERLQDSSAKGVIWEDEGM